MENWAAGLCKKLDVDDVVGLEAVDVTFDSTLDYAENKKLLEDELAHRGIFGVAPALDTPEFRELEELPPYMAPAELSREVRELRAERERLEGRLKELMAERKRWKTLSESERARFLAEISELKRRLSEVAKAKPPEVRPPAPPRVPRVPRVPPPPRLVEFVCPACKKPLMKVTEIEWTERVPIMERPEPMMALVPTGRYEEVRYTRKIPEAELVFMCMAGMGEEYKGIMAELKLWEYLTEEDRKKLTGMLIELEGRMKAECPYGGTYFKVRRGRLIGPVAKSEVLKQILAPPPAPRLRAPAPPLEMIREYTRMIEAEPEFRAFVEESGFPWATYLRLDPYSKEALRESYRAKMM